MYYSFPQVGVFIGLRCYQHEVIVYISPAKVTNGTDVLSDKLVVCVMSGIQIFPELRKHIGFHLASAHLKTDQHPANNNNKRKEPE